MGQLKGDLDEGIGTRAALLYQTFAKVVKGENVRVNVVCQSCGHCQRVLDDFLALKEMKKTKKTKSRSEFKKMSLNIAVTSWSFLVKTNKLFNRRSLLASPINRCYKHIKSSRNSTMAKILLLHSLRVSSRGSQRPCICIQIPHCVLNNLVKFIKAT